MSSTEIAQNYLGQEYYNLIQQVITDKTYLTLILIPIGTMMGFIAPWWFFEDVPWLRHLLKEKRGIHLIEVKSYHDNWQTHFNYSNRSHILFYNKLPNWAEELVER